MFRNSAIAAAGIVLVAAVFFAGHGSGPRVPGAGWGRVLYYPDPTMHSAFGSIAPGLRIHATETGMVRDPVCGMRIKSQDAHRWTETRHGWESHFCSEACRKAFRQSPDRYIGGDEHETRKILRDAVRL